MTGMPDPSFTPTFKYPSQQSTQVGKCNKSLPVECSNANCNRSEYAGLHQSLDADQQHRADLPGSRKFGSRSSPDPFHPCNSWTCVLDLRSNRLDDRRIDAKCLPVDKERQDAKRWSSNNRSEHAGHGEPIEVDRQHSADLPGCSRSGSRSRSNFVHLSDRRTSVLDIRGNRINDRRSDALCVQVRNKNKPAGGLQARILLLALLISIAIVPLVSATTYLSFNPVGMDPDDLHIYNSSGTLIGIYNTSSTAIPLISNQSYSILVVPASQNLLGNHPQAWFELFVTKLRENAVGFIIAIFLVAVLIAALRR